MINSRHLTSDIAIQTYLAKAQESLAGAASEYANDRYNNCANRAYYACFQAAIAALSRAGIAPAGRREQWSHAFVPAAFVGELIKRRKRYSANLRDVLTRTYALREIAEYKLGTVSRVQASRLLDQARTFVRSVTATEGDRP